MQVPTPPQKPHLHKDPYGPGRPDPYHWLKNKKDPDVIKYLEQENAYLDAAMADTKNFQEELFQELKGRLKETDQSVPYPYGPFEYYTAIEQGQEYHSHHRKLRATGESQLLLDENTLAEGKEYFDLGALSISPNHKLLIWGADLNGSEHYTLRIRDLSTGEDLEDVLTGTSGSVAWLKDSSGFLYTTLNDKDRPDKIMLHILGEDPKTDRLIFEEKDPQFFIGCELSKDKEVLFISCSGKITSETLWLPAGDPSQPLRSVYGRREGVRYSCEHLKDQNFLVLTDDEEPNYRLVTVNSAGAVTKEWVRGTPEIYLEAFDIQKSYFLYYYRERGLPKICWVDFATETFRVLPFEEKTYALGPGYTPELDSPTFRFSFSSPKTPRRVLEYNTQTETLTTLKVQEIPSGYNSENYDTDYVFFTSHDGVQVPVSLLYKKGTPLDGSSRLYLTAYGSYGLAYPASFSPHRFSLVDRGFITAIAHIRGGSELGRRWYESGKFLKKKNTFKDFIAVAKGLVDKGYTSPGKLAIQGGSAGGMLVGAVLNKAPELFGAAVAHVPFVDVLTTMLDDTLPLTPLEYTEWGNPQEEQYFHYMLSYSPYDNLKPSEKYPPLLITAGLNDRRVTYWEPAKWCAKLRELYGENATVFLKTNMGAGHGGSSGRYESLKELALEYAFLLKVL